jgi:formate dehydrogenase assembly factor FdhD
MKPEFNVGFVLYQGIAAANDAIKEMNGVAVGNGAGVLEVTFKKRKQTFPKREDQDKVVKVEVRRKESRNRKQGKEKVLKNVVRTEGGKIEKKASDEIQVEQKRRRLAMVIFRKLMRG